MALCTNPVGPLVAVALAGSSALMLACQTGENPASWQEPSEPWFAGRVGAVEPCEPAPRVSLGVVAVDISVSSEVRRRDALDLIAKIRADAERSGITLRPARAWVRWFAAIELFTDETGTDVSSTDRTLAGTIAPLRTFLQTYSPPPLDRIHIVIVGDVIPDKSPLARLTRFDGMTLASGLSDGSEGASLVQTLGLDEFRSTVFLSQRRVRAMSREDVATTALHELGHAFGLSHESELRNVMSPSRRPRRCPEFSQIQKQKIQRALRALYTRRTDL